MKLKNIKVGVKVVPKKAYKARYNKPDVSTIDLYSDLITLDNDAPSFTPDYFCENYKLHKETV